MTINGTDYRILQKGAARKGNAFGSFKYVGKSALHYELGVDILAGNLIWVSGPYPAGKYTDIAIFNSVLANCLKPGERVEADNGYVGRPDKIKCPNNDCNPAENRVMQGIARSRHETLNGRLKAWLSWKCHRHVATCRRRHNVLLQFWPDGSVSQTQN
jgi:hypothetical protein